MIQEGMSSTPQMPERPPKNVLENKINKIEEEIGLGSMNEELMTFEDAKRQAEILASLKKGEDPQYPDTIVIQDSSKKSGLLDRLKSFLH